MIVTVASFKGGVSKSMTAIHLAAFLNARAPTILGSLLGTDKIVR